MPELAHWFGLRWADIETMPYAEVEEFIDRLKDLPPLGWRLSVHPSEVTLGR